MRITDVLDRRTARPRSLDRVRPFDLDVDLPDASGRRTILHVTESFASGTASAIGDIVRNYPDADHHLVYALRDGAGVDPRDLRQFVTTWEMPEGHLARVKFLRRFLRETTGATIVHAHSSKAGVYVRAAVRRSKSRPIVYTPHCYAFERRDVGLANRLAFRSAEWLLSFNTSAYGACSPREATLSRWRLSSPTVVVVPNVMPPALPPSRRNPAGGRLRIVGNGRLGPQKDPTFFAEAFAAAAADNPGVEALWVGGGEERYVRQLEDCGVTVTGWLTRTEALDAMASGDVYLHTALWEGFPISVMEAAGMGLPVISRRRPYLEGVELPVVIDEPEELSEVIRRLNRPAEMSALRAATQTALQANTDAHQRRALRALYDPVSAPAWTG